MKCVVFSFVIFVAAMWTGVAEWHPYYPQPGTGDMQAVVIWQDNTVIGVGNRGLALRGETGDWRSLSVDGVPNLYAICGDNSWNTIAVGEAGVILMMAGYRFSCFDLGLTEDLYAVAWGHEGDLWLGGDYLYRYDGYHLTKLELINIRTIIADSENKIWVVSDGEIHVFQAGAWSSVEWPDTSEDRILRKGSDGQMYAVCWSKIFVWTGSDWALIAEISDTLLPANPHEYFYGPYDIVVFDDGTIWMYYLFSYSMRTVTYYYFIIKIDPENTQSRFGWEFESLTAIFAIGSTGYMWAEHTLRRLDDDTLIPVEPHFNWGNGLTLSTRSFVTNVFSGSGYRLWVNYATRSYYSTNDAFAFTWPGTIGSSSEINYILQLCEPSPSTFIALTSSHDSFVSDAPFPAVLCVKSPGQSWQTEVLPQNLEKSTGIAAVSSDLYWISGEAGIFVRRNGGEWEQELAPDSTPSIITTLLALPNGEIMGFGYDYFSDGTIVRRKTDGVWEYWAFDNIFKFNVMAYDEINDKLWIAASVKTQDWGYETRVMCLKDDMFETIELPWQTKSASIMSMVIDNGVVYCTGNDRYIYTYSSFGWQREDTGSELYKWLVRSENGMLMLIDESFRIYTTLDCFQRLEGSVRVSLNAIKDSYAPGEELVLTAKAVAGDSQSHQAQLHAVIEIAGEYFFYPDWSANDTGVSVNFDPENSLEHELLRLQIPPLTDAVSIDLWVYLLDSNGALLGNITRRVFSLYP